MNTAHVLKVNSNGNTSYFRKSAINSIEVVDWNDFPSANITVSGYWFSLNFPDRKKLEEFLIEAGAAEEGDFDE